MAQPFVGRLSDRARTPLGRRRPFFLAGVPLTAVALLLLGLHPPFALMIAVVSVAAFFLSIAYDPYLAMMADLAPPTQRGRIGAILAVAGMPGSIVFSLVAEFLWSAHEFAVFLVTAAGLVVAFGVTFVAVREPPRSAGVPAGGVGVSPTPAATAVSTMADAHAGDGVPAGSRRSQWTRRDGVPAGSDSESERRRSRGVRQYVRDVRRYPALARYVVALGIFYLGTGGATPFVTLFATKALGVSAGQAFFLLIVLVLCTALGAAPVGLVADRVGKKRVLVAGLAVFSAGTLFGSQAPSVGWEIPAMVLIGLGNACPNALAVPLLADLASAPRIGDFIGLGSFIWSVTQPAGSFCAGLFVTGALPSTYRHAFVWAGVLIAAAAVALLLVHPVAGSDPASRAADDVALTGFRTAARMDEMGDTAEDGLDMAMEL